MSTGNLTATPNCQAEPSLTSNVIVASGLAPGTVSGELSEPKETAARPASASSAKEVDEETLWEGRYSPKNFLGRAIFGGLFVLAWVALAVATWALGHSNLTFLTYATAFVVVAYWLFLGFKFLRVERNHHYRLTTRRLFLTTGLFQRRVDQVELVRVQDLFVRQSLLGSWLNVGTVVLISSEQTLPKAHLMGIEEPRRVLDLIWRHTRKERDRPTTEANHV